MNSAFPEKLPLALGTALMKNADAFLYFSALDAKKQDRIIERSRSINSGSQMESFVNSIMTVD